MRELIVTEFVSLDGVMEAPGGEAGYAHAGWVGPYFSAELGAYKFEEQNGADVLLIGRATFESFAGAWPNRDDPMADKINAMRKLVVSTTLGSSDWHDTTVIADDPEQAIRAVKDEDGGPILVPGSRTLVRWLLECGLVDQLNLQVFPLVLGSGARLYPETGQPLRLSLISSRALESGVVLQSYAPQPTQAPAPWCS
jgi:dihydrofolate reductase